MRTTTASSVSSSCRTVDGERRSARRRPPSQASATGSGPWYHPWRCGRLSVAEWRVRPRRRDRAPCAGCGLGVGRAGGSWAASSPSRRYCGTKTDTTSPEGPACAKTSGSAGAVDDSGVVGSVWPCDVAQRSCAHGPVPGAGATAARGGRLAAPPLVADAEPSGACPCSAASARHVATCAAVADRSVRVVWARPAAHRRAVSGHRPAPLTRWCVARGGGAARCAGRRCRSGARARGASAPAAPNTRQAGPRRRAVPVR